MKKHTVIATIALLVCVASLTIAAEEKSAGPNVIRAAKEVEGVVTAVGKDYIAVAYDRDLEKGTEQEIFLPVETGIRIVHKKKITEINVGDTVKVAYNEDATEHEAGKVDKTRKASVITFLRPAEKRLEPEEAVDLSLKGLKGD